MLREGPRIPAYPCETGDWSHVDVYLTRSTDYRMLLLAGSRWEDELLRWTGERGSTVVAVGAEVEGAAYSLRYAGDEDDDVRLLGEVLVASCSPRTSGPPAADPSAPWRRRRAVRRQFARSASRAARTEPHCRSRVTTLPWKVEPSMVFASPLPDVEIPDVPLTEYVLARAERLGDKPALIDGGSGRTLTYAGLAGAVRSLAGGLAAKGFGKGDVLALMSPNIPEYAVIFHGVAIRGRHDHHDQPDVHRSTRCTSSSSTRARRSS